MIERIEFDSVEIQPGCSANITVYSEKGPFRLLNMVISPEVAEGFFVTDIKVGKNSELFTTGAIAASYYAQRGGIEDLIFDKLPRGFPITLSVTNGRKTSAKFAGFLRGNLEGDGAPSKRLPQDRIAAGLGSSIVPPGGLLNLRIQVQAPFRPDCLVLPPEVSERLHVKEVRVVGQVMELDRTDPLILLFPAALMQVCDWLTIEVENKTKFEQRFYGACGGSIIFG